MTTIECATFDAEAAEGILRRACATAAVDSDGIEMLRFGDHAVFRIDAGRIVARVDRSPERLPTVRWEVAVAAWLAAEAYPAARLVTDAEQPRPPGDLLGSAGRRRYVRHYGRDGRTLAAAPRIGAAALLSPALRPFDKVAKRLEQAVIPDGTRSYLSALAEGLEGEYGRLAFALPAGPLHGDFNVGNVLRDSAGRPKVIDLDGFVTGPREWDLMQTAMYYDSFGWHTESEYADFVRGTASTCGSGRGTPCSAAFANSS